MIYKYNKQITKKWNKKKANNKIHPQQFPDLKQSLFSIVD